MAFSERFQKQLQSVVGDWLFGAKVLIQSTFPQLVLRPKRPTDRVGLQMQDLSGNTVTLSMGSPSLKVGGGVSVVLADSALSSADTDGFTYLPTLPGAPTTTPTTQLGTVPLIYDTVGDKLYVYNGTWLEQGGANFGTNIADGFVKRNSGNTDWEQVPYGTTANTVCEGNDSRIGAGTLYPAFTEPVNGDFSWVNQGAASVDTSNGGIYLLAPANASNNIRIRKQSTTATPWTLTIGFIPFVYDANYSFCGIAVRESSTSKLLLWGFGYVDNPTLRCERYSNETTFNAEILGKNSRDIRTLNQSPIMYYRLNDNGTNLIYSYSMDGLHFRVHKTESRTAYLAGGPNEFGFFASAFNASNDAGIWLRHWQVT